LNRRAPTLPHAPKALVVRAFRVIRGANRTAAGLLINATLLHAKKDAAMRTIDFSPLYRSVVGFDRLADLLDAAAADAGTGYPPYNIERTGENDYRIEIAVAGFKPEELNIEVKEGVVTVQGRKAANDEPRRYLHRGLAERNFERRFQLAEYVAVTDAHLADGLLQIALKRELPEALKPRTIEVKTGVSTLIEADKAA
jgi:molecular chaperone IbpA